jgi:hypothetical protein
VLDHPEVALLAPWLIARDTRDAAVHLAVRRALCDTLVMEAPPGSNRGQRIDSYNLGAGAPIGSPYCAGAVTFWWRYGGLQVPPRDPAYWRRIGKPILGPASCDAWYWWAIETLRFSATPTVGSAILYGNSLKTEDPSWHMGIVVRTNTSDGQKRLVTFEANTSLDGEYDRDGVAFDRRVIGTISHRPILGYVRPYPIGG